MSDSIRPVDGAPAAPQVRRVTPRRRGEKDEAFEEELANPGKDKDSKKGKPSNEERSVSPPTEDDIGSHLDLSG